MIGINNREWRAIHKRIADLKPPSPLWKDAAFLLWGIAGSCFIAWLVWRPAYAQIPVAKRIHYAGLGPGLVFAACVAAGVGFLCYVTHRKTAEDLSTKCTSICGDMDVIEQASKAAQAETPGDQGGFVTRSGGCDKYTVPEESRPGMREVQPECPSTVSVTSMTQGVRLTQEQIDAIAESLEVNPHWRAAAIHAGVNENTLHDYRRRAESYANRLHNLHDEPDPEQYYFDAVQVWNAARDRLETRCVVGLLRHGEKDWRPLHAVLKALAPQDWSDRVELTGAGGGPIQVEALKAEALARADEALEQLGLRALSDPGAEAAPAGNDE